MFAEQGPPYVIGVDDIKIINKDTVKNQIDSSHNHGFFNELYRFFADQVNFQVRDTALFFEITLYGADAAASESDMVFEFDAAEIRDILIGYFSRHHDVFIQYFPEYEAKVAALGKRDTSLFEEVLAELEDSSITEVRGADGNELLTKLSGLLPYLFKDRKSKKELNEMFALKKLQAIHEYTHQILHRMGEYYGLHFEEASKGIILSVVRDPDLKALRTTLMQKNWNNYPKNDPVFLQELGETYIKAIVKKLSENVPSSVSSSHIQRFSTPEIHNYLKNLYKGGVEEIVIRLLEAQLQNHSVEEALNHLDQALFKTSGYYLKPSGIIFPKSEEVTEMIQTLGLQRAFHAILEKFYNDEAFQIILEKLEV